MNSLQDIWNERIVGLVGTGPIKVLQQGLWAGDRVDTFCLIGIDKHSDTAFGYYEKANTTLVRRTASKKKWLLWTEPKPVAHWPAITKGICGNSGISKNLYSSDEAAREVLAGNFIRLIKEWPPVMITPEDDN